MIEAHVAEVRWIEISLIGQLGFFSLPPLSVLSFSISHSKVLIHISNGSHCLLISSRSKSNANRGLFSCSFSFSLVSRISASSLVFHLIFLYFVHSAFASYGIFFSLSPLISLHFPLPPNRISIGQRIQTAHAKLFFLSTKFSWAFELSTKDENGQNKQQMKQMRKRNEKNRQH